MLLTMALVMFVVIINYNYNDIPHRKTHRRQTRITSRNGSTNNQAGYRPISSMMSSANVRHRRPARRGDYSLLGDDSSSEHSGRMGFLHTRPSAKRACDSCWNKHVRREATKCCITCRQDMCDTCAGGTVCDSDSRPWWVPAFIFNCWQFLFTSSVKPHSIVAFGGENGIPNGYQSDGSQVSRGSGFPRQARVERCSNNSYDNALVDSSRNSSLSDVSGMLASSEVRKNSSRECLVKPSGKRVGVLDKRRTCGYSSGDRLPVNVMGYYPEDASEREKIRRYKENWDVDTFPENDTNMYSHKLKGKDVDVELSGKEIKITVNQGRSRTREQVCYKPNRVPQFKPQFPDPYTEKIFHKVPIWFKHPSKKSKVYTINKENRHGVKDGKQPIPLQSGRHRFFDRTPGIAIPHRQNTEERRPRWESFSDSASNQSNTPRHRGQLYTVEEPEDMCSICLEVLSKKEARMLKCCHQLHTVCLNQLLRKADSDFGIKCPVCNRTTPVTNYYAPRNLWYKELTRA